EIDLHGAYDEGEARRLLLDLLEQRTLIGAEQAKIVGSAALHEAQIACVIDDAGKIGVLVVDANRLDMPAVPNFAVKRCTHRHGTFWPIDRSQFWPSNCLIGSSPTSISSRQRALTSILSGSERGT